MTRYWCEYAWLGGESVEEGVTIEVEGDRIVALSAGEAAGPDAVRLNGITLPAPANAHSHAFHRALRGRTHSEGGTFWSWRRIMYEVADRLNPDNYFQLALATFGEMALAGIGAVGEFHYLHHRPGGAPYDDANAMGLALVAAAGEAGIRLTLLDTLYLHGGLADGHDAPDPYVSLASAQQRFGDRSAPRWAERIETLRSAAQGPLVNIGAAAHSVRAVDPESMAVVGAWCDAHDAPLHVHVSEQPAENQQCLARFGCTPIELLDGNGLLGPLTTLVHATHVSGADVDRISGSGSGCCLCPTTERDLADGVGPAASLAAAGVALSVGSDSHAVIDLFEEARAVELDQRLVTGRRGIHKTPDLIEMATGSGYRALGWPDGGRLDIGCLADFTTVASTSVRLAGCRRGTALASILFSATAADVRHVVVGGRVIVAEGRHVSMDVADALARSIGEVLNS